MTGGSGLMAGDAGSPVHDTQRRAAPGPAASTPGSGPALSRVPPDARRVVAVALLLAVAGAGLSVRAPLSSSGPAALRSAGGHALDDVAGGLAAVAALAAVAIIVAALRGRRWRRQPGGDDTVRRGPEDQWPWWARPAALLFALAMLAVPVVLLVLAIHGLHQGAHFAGPGPVPAATPRVTRPATSAQPHARRGSAWPVGAGMIAMAAVALALLASVRSRSAAGSRPGAGAEPGQAPVRPALGTALAAGAVALGQGEDARTAIIGCYAAMERSLAAAGLALAVADTPAEVVARAASRGFVRSAAAGTLTSLFREARYSDHRLREADRNAALGALAQLRDDLGGRA